MRLTAQIEMRAQLYDVDALGVVWNGNYFRYFEQARVALMEKINYGFEEMRKSGYAWPIIQSNVRYVYPIILGQVFQVEAEILQYEFRLRIGYVIQDAVSHLRLTRGYTDQVAINMATSEMCFRSPDALINRLKEN